MSRRSAWVIRVRVRVNVNVRVRVRVRVRIVAQVRLGDLRREASHPQRGDPLVLGRRELGLLPGPVQVLLGEQVLLGAVVPGQG